MIVHFYAADALETMRKQCPETITHTSVTLSCSTTRHLLLICCWVKNYAVKWRQSMTSVVFEGMVTQAACPYKACQGWLYDGHDYVVEYSRSWDNAWILSKILPASWQKETDWRLWTILKCQHDVCSSWRYVHTSYKYIYMLLQACHSWAQWQPCFAD